MKRSAVEQQEGVEEEVPPSKKAANGDMAAPKPRRVPTPTTTTTPSQSPSKPKTPPPASKPAPTRPPRAETPESIHKEPNAAAATETAGDPITGFRVSPENVAQLAARNITAFFPIQSATYNPIYEGKDLVGRALTGSGKTLSFVLPVVERMAVECKGLDWKVSGRLPRVLCLAPTRELARQDADEFKRCTAHLDMNTVLVYGGVPISTQSNLLWRGADIVVGTPGRVNDLIERKDLVLTALRHSILDEADEMLSIGFAEDVEKILANAPTGDSAPQTLLFSATMPDWVQKVAAKFLRKEHTTVDLVGRSRGSKIPEGVVHMALCCLRSSTEAVLRNLILAPAETTLTKDSRTIVFVSMKRDADSLQAALAASVSCQVIHGNVSQEHREQSLRDFRAGRFSVLIATDVAARGLDISGVERVVNTSPPKEVESYIHRAGRTGRAGKTGFAITFYQRSEASILRNLEAKTGITFKRIGVPQPFKLARAALSGVTDDIAKLPRETWMQFADDAKALTEKCNGDAAEALARTLAMLAKVPKQGETPSLLGGVVGYKTLLMRTRMPLPHPGVAVSCLRDYMPEGGGAREICLCPQGAVLDLPEKAVQSVISQGPYRNVLGFEVLEELPEGVTIPSNDDAARDRERRSGLAGRSGGGGGRNLRNAGNRFGAGARFSRQRK